VSVTRADLLSYVTGEHAGLLSEAGISLTDTQAGLKSVLDKSFRVVGVSEDDLPTATTDAANAAKIEAAADYYTYDRLARVFARWVSVSKGVGGASVSQDRSQVYTQVTAERDRMKAICTTLGLTVDLADSAIFTINLDFLEPVDAL
jgi:hypothetical protein